MYVVRKPCDEAGSDGINTYDLEKECTVVTRFAL